MKLPRRKRATALAVLGLTVAAALALVAAVLIPQTSHRGQGLYGSLADTRQGMHFALIGNLSVGTQTDKSIERGHVDYVWGAQRGGRVGKVSFHPHNHAVPRVHHTLYAPLLSSAFGQTKQWWLTNHPDWILYRNDRRTPVRWFAAPAYEEWITLDVSNPAVIQWKLAHQFYLAVDRGFQGLAFDNMSTESRGAAGIYLTASRLAERAFANQTSIRLDPPLSLQASSRVAIAIGNGADMEYLRAEAQETAGAATMTVFPALTRDHAAGERVGIWVQKYSGNDIDDAFRRDVKRAFATVSAATKRYAAQRGDSDFLVSINNGIDVHQWRAFSLWNDLVPLADVIVDEQGFTQGGRANEDGSPQYLTSDAPVSTPAGMIMNPWLTKIRAFQHLNRVDKAWVVIDNLPYTRRMPGRPPTAANKFDRQWALANYLLVKGSHSYQAMLNTYQHMIVLPEYRAPIGFPTSSMYESQGVYMRNYSSGLAIVNPSGRRSFTLSLPRASYVDLHGHTVEAVVMAPHSGLILLSTSNSQPAR